MSTIRNIFITNDNKTITDMNENFTKFSITVKNLIEDIDDNSQPIPLSESSTSLKLVNSLLNFVNENSGKEIETTETIEEKEKREKEEKINTDGINEILSALTKDQLFEMILCLNYLDMKYLMDIICKKVANHMKGMKVVEMREYLNLENDFTPEEEEQVRKENEWLLEDSKE